MQPLYNYGTQYANYAFNRDVYLMRQKVMAINEKYYVWDAENRPIMFVERPAHLARNAFAGLAGTIGCLGTFVLFVMLATSVSAGYISAPLILAGYILARLVGGALSLALSKKRHVTFFSDEEKTERLLEVYQDRKFQFPIANYTVLDAWGNVIARMRKNYIYNILRKRWEVYNPQGELLVMAKEDSIVKSVLRRVLGPLFGLLRTNFIVVEPSGADAVMGEFNRKLALLDKYVLDMTPDWQRQLDRRLAIALGVMLDTGEGR